jgi:hypothetical protein
LPAVTVPVAMTMDGERCAVVLIIVAPVPTGMALLRPAVEYGAPETMVAETTSFAASTVSAASPPCRS